MGTIVNLAVLVALGWAAWYGYSSWTASSTDSGNRAPAATFNCRQALARLAEDQACLTSDSCTLTRDELAVMKQREADIEQHCN
jgi:hypothetical protein